MATILMGFHLLSPAFAIDIIHFHLIFPQLQSALFTFYQILFVLPIFALDFSLSR